MKEKINIDDLEFEFDSKEIIKKGKVSRIPDREEKYHSYILILYEDSTIYDYDLVLNTIKGSYKKYAYIEHFPESNELKKHTHVYLYFDNSVYVTSLEKKLGIPYYYFQLPYSNRGCMRYLTHIDYPDKIQYSLQDVTISKSLLKTFLSKYDDEKLDEEILDDIYNFLDDNKNLPRVILEKELSRFTCSANYTRIFNRYYKTIEKYIDYISTSYNI